MEKFIPHNIVDAAIFPMVKEIPVGAEESLQILQDHLTFDDLEDTPYSISSIPQDELDDPDIWLDAFVRKYRMPKLFFEMSEDSIYILFSQAPAESKIDWLASLPIGISEIWNDFGRFPIKPQIFTLSEDKSLIETISEKLGDICGMIEYCLVNQNFSRIIQYFSDNNFLDKDMTDEILVHYPPYELFFLMTRFYTRPLSEYQNYLAGMRKDIFPIGQIIDRLFYTEQKYESFFQELFQNGIDKMMEKLGIPEGKYSWVNYSSDYADMYLSMMNDPEEDPGIIESFFDVSSFLSTYEDTIDKISKFTDKQILEYLRQKGIRDPYDIGTPEFESRWTWIYQNLQIVFTNHQKQLLALENFRRQMREYDQTDVSLFEQEVEDVEDDDVEDSQDWLYLDS